MPISEESRPPGNRAAEAQVVFGELFGVVHAALTEHYEIPDLEARELEADLYVWFLQFCRVPGQTPVRQLAAYLLVAACHCAREYQSHRLETLSALPDERLARMLAREADDVAREEFSEALEALGSTVPHGN